jgi:hypothetical protein
MDGDAGWRYTRRGALGLMGAGAVGVGLETVGFTNLTAGRGVGIGVSDDTNAKLQVTVSGGSEDGNALSNSTDYTDPLDVEFKNTDSSLSIELTGITITNNSGESISSDFSSSTTLDKNGGNTTVSFSLDSTDDTRNEGTIDIEAEATVGSGVSLTINRTDISIVDPSA